ncbi:MAG: COX15/CtaA family protein, partial [Pseudomonadota bacterium]
IPWMVGLLLLGGLQGFVGWYMVQSGLVDRVDVSQYRLALHLSIAFLILGLLVWCFLTLARRTQPVTLTTLSSRTLVIAGGLLALVFAQVALGAFVAGTKAGVNYNTWPLMDGEFVPAGLFDMTPLWINAVENVTMIQFNHRMTAYLLVIAVTVHAAIVWRRTDAHDAANSALALAVAVWLQAVTGIWTLLAAEGAIPIGLGLVHQGGAAIVLTIAVWHWHAVWRDVVHRPANLWRAA